MPDPIVCIMYLGSRGGGSLFALQLIRHLRSSGARMSILGSVQAANTDLARFERLSDRIVTLDYSLKDLKSGRLLRYLRACLGHVRAIRACRPAAVVVTMNAPLCVPVVLLLRMAGLRIVYVAHDAVPHPGDFFPMVQRGAQGMLMALAHEVVALSAHVQQRLSARGGRTIRLIPLEAVETVEGHGHPAMPPGQVLDLLFLGRLLRYKGLQLLHDALVPMRGRGDWRLTIAGDGPLAPWVRQAFAGWPQVTLELGWLDETRIDTLMDQHHLLLCPYTEASQSGVVSRAMARGLPALVTPVGGLPEQVGPLLSQVLVAREATAPALAAALAGLLDDPAAVERLSRDGLEQSRRRCAATAWAELVR